MLSLKERIALLEQDLVAVPPRIGVYHDLPFAILRYDPEDEWNLRRQLHLLEARLEEKSRKVVNISLAGLLWEAIEKTEGIEAVVQLEKDQGFSAAQEQINSYLSDPDWCPLPALLAEKMAPLDQTKHIVFLTRASAMAPSLYHMSRLLDEMQGKTKITTILFYPGSIEGNTGLRFMGIKDRESFGNYRAKIYA